MMTLLALSLFITEPAPLEMPRATGYLVSEGKTLRLEDRYNRVDLWLNATVEGRWIDEEGRTFVLSELRYEPPYEVMMGQPCTSLVTRTAYAAECKTIARRDERVRRLAIAALSPVEIASEPLRPKQTPRHYKRVEYLQGTNRTAIVCAYQPKGAEVWRLATWTLHDGDDYGEALKRFEGEFLEREAVARLKKTEAGEEQNLAERELLRRDARKSVSAYEGWRVTDSEEFTVLDDLSWNRDFIVALTNDLKKMRKRYAETVPSPIDGSNVLAVARIYASRDEYLDALEADGLTNMSWSAAYWSQARRELVAYMPPEGAKELLATIRHEAFHQYLAYAASMIATSPWFNEGYAQYFEENAGDFNPPTKEELKELAKMIPALINMDYAEFYSGSDLERRLKYQLALMVVGFIEKGAPLVRFEPFKKLKENYMTTLLKVFDMREATAAAFENSENLEAFVKEWTAYFAKGGKIW